VALLFAWLGRLAGVPASVPLTIGVVLAALIWLVVLVTVPWNLYFEARQVLVEMATSHARGIVVGPDRVAEATRIARRLIWLAIGAHLLTTAATGVAAYLSGLRAGYYAAGFYLLSIAVRPAVAYLGHLRRRINALGRDSTYPREDVVTLRQAVTDLTEDVKGLRTELERGRQAATEQVDRASADLAHLRGQVDTDLARLEGAQAVDRASARTGDDELRTVIERMVRRVDATLDGVSDHQELLTGIRALVRMIRTDPT
jgi:hypothetical protein